MHVTDHPLRNVSGQSLQAIIGNCAHKIVLGTSAAAPGGQDPQEAAGEPA
jgi:hypothetical protein